MSDVKKKTREKNTMLPFTNWQKLLDNINDNDKIENEFKATKNFKEAILWTTVECLSR